MTPTAQILAQVVRAVAYVAGSIVATWLFFGPIAGFHHMLRCGIFTPVFLDGELLTGRRVVSILGEQYALIVSPGRLALSFVLWAVCVFFWVRFIGRQGHVG